MQASKQCFVVHFENGKKVGLEVKPGFHGTEKMINLNVLLTLKDLAYNINDVKRIERI